MNYLSIFYLRSRLWAVLDPLETSWFWLRNSLVMVLVQPVWSRMIYRIPFVDNTLRTLIQLNLGSLSLQLWLHKQVLIICESSIGALLLSILLQLYLVIIPCISFIPTLAEYQPQVYSTLLFCPATQKMMVDWNSLMRSSRLVLPRLLSCDLWSLLWSAYTRVIVVFNWQYLCNNYTLFVIFGYLWTLSARVYGKNDPRHSCGKYSILA
jgi:hypothetical protein